MIVSYNIICIDEKSKQDMIGIDAADAVLQVP
jgi:hypothetical protein